MKRWMKTAAVASATALIGLAAPAASAAEASAPGDVAGCTSVLAAEAGGWVPTELPARLVGVTYTPPATVTVDADPAVGVITYVATNIAGDVVAFVECVG